MWCWFCNSLEVNDIFKNLLNLKWRKRCLLWKRKGLDLICTKIFRMLKVLSVCMIEQAQPRFKNLFDLLLFHSFPSRVERHYMQIKEYKWNSNSHVYENVGPATFTLITSVGLLCLQLDIICPKATTFARHGFMISYTFLSVETPLPCCCLMMFVFFWVTEIRRWSVHWFEYISSIWEGFCSLELWKDWKPCIFAHKANKEVGSWRPAFEETYALSYRYFSTTTLYALLWLISYNLSCCYFSFLIEV